MSHLWFPSRHTVWRQLWALQWLFCTSWLVPNPVVRLLAEQKGTPSYFTHVSCFKGLRTTEAWHISGHCVNRCPRTCWTRTAGHSLILSFQHFNCTDWSCTVLLHSKPFWMKWGQHQLVFPKGSWSWAMAASLAAAWSGICHSSLDCFYHCCDHVPCELWHWQAFMCSKLNCMLNVPQGIL